MRMQSKVIVRVALLALVPIFATQISHAQITNEIQATISHPFVIDNTTLPPGKYNFRMLSGSNQTAMIAASADGKTSIEFTVRNAYDTHVPQHTELIFNRYDGKEFLHKIFEAGRHVTTFAMCCCTSVEKVCGWKVVCATSRWLAK